MCVLFDAGIFKAKQVVESRLQTRGLGLTQPLAPNDTEVGRKLNRRVEIIVVERSGHVSFANCGLPYHVGDIIKSRSALLLHLTPESGLAAGGLARFSAPKLRAVKSALRRRPWPSLALERRALRSG